MINDTTLAQRCREGGVHPINLGSHKGKAVRRALRKAGARLFFLPKYSPDLNRIEQLFDNLKHWLRKAARRSVETVCQAIGQILNSVTPIDAQTTSQTQDMTEVNLIPL